MAQHAARLRVIKVTIPSEGERPDPEAWPPKTYGDCIQAIIEITEFLRKLRTTQTIDEDLQTILASAELAKTLITDNEIRSFVLTAGQEGRYPGVGDDPGV